MNIATQTFRTLFTKSTLACLGMIAVMTLATLPAIAQAADHPAAKFIEKLGTSAINSLTVKEITTRERESRVRTMLRSSFDLPTIARFAMGTYWKTATEKQKAEYLVLFEDMIVKTYARRFAEYSGQSFQVAGAIPANEKDSVVSSQIIQTDGPAVNLEWRVRSKSGTLKVVDVIVEGISMSVTQRSDFAAVIQRGGGNVEKLIETLRLRKNGAIAEKQ